MPHLFLALFEFFLNALPAYTENSEEKPNQFEPDLEKAPKMVFTAHVNRSLLCADHSPAAKTLAF